MSSSNTNDNDPDDIISISGSLLDDTHIDFGLEQEEEDSVFDQSLMRYLDQLPIAAPPADAKYSTSFVDSVLNDMEAFKQETKYLNYNDIEEPLISSMLGYSQFEPEEAYSLAQDQTFSVAVEQPRAYTGQQEQLYQEQEEIPIQLNMHQDDQHPFEQPALSIDHSTEYSDCLDLFSLGQDQLNDREFKTTFLAQRKAELDALFNLNEDAHRDFSSWLYYPDEDASQMHLKDDMSHPITNALDHETSDYAFSNEYSIDSKYEANDPYFTTANKPLEQSYLSSKLQPQVQPDDTINYAYGEANHQTVDEFLQRMGAIVAENLARVKSDPLAIHNNINNDKPSSSSAIPTSHAKASLRGNARHSSSVNISKADFMLVSSTSPSKHNSNLSGISKKNESEGSFVKRIAGTSTPVKKNSKQQLASQKNLSTNQHSGNGKRRTTVLEEVNKNATSTSSSHRYSMRARTCPGVIRKTSTTLNKSVKSRTFNFGSSKKR